MGAGSPGNASYTASKESAATSWSPVTSEVMPRYQTTRQSSGCRPSRSVSAPAAESGSRISSRARSSRSRVSSEAAGTACRAAISSAGAEAISPARNPAFGSFASTPGDRQRQGGGPRVEQGEPDTPCGRPEGAVRAGPRGG
ncbi:hypothetical protein SMICM304S_05625 [Streptomyces microflavus]